MSSESTQGQEQLLAWLQKNGQWRFAGPPKPRPVASLAAEPGCSVTASLFEVPSALLSLPSLHEDEEEGAVSASIVIDATEAATEENEPRRGLTCRACGLVFEARGEQQQHFRSTLHLHNLRRRLAGKPLLAAGQTGGAAAGEDGASGSDEDERDESGDESDEDSDQDTAAGGADATAAGDEAARWDVALDGDADSSATDRVVAIAGIEQEAMFLWRGQQWAFAVSVAALERPSPRAAAIGDGSKETDRDPWHCLARALAPPAAPGVMSRLWTVILMRSGKFAGAVFEGQEVVTHKIFRRYTMRAKRGGAQSAHDASGKRPKSAGATLRRYGEQALRDDVRGLLREWSRHLAASRVLLLSVPKALRAVLFDGKDAPVDRADPRIRWTPFMVGRPTFEEARAVHARATTITFLPAAAAEAKFAAQQPTAKPQARTESGGTLPRGGAAAAEPGKAAAAAEAAAAAPELPACPPSQRLVAACRAGDMEEVERLLQELRVRDTGAEAMAATAAVLAAGAQEEGLPSRSVAVAEPRGTALNFVRDDLTGERSAAAASNGVAATATAASAAAASENVAGSSSNGAGSAAAAAQLERSISGGWEASVIINMPDGLEMLQTPLHIASAAGNAAVVAALLEAGADPLRIDVRGRTPYFLATAKEVRDAFRRRRADAPEQWDWDAAGVGEPLTDELERKKRQKEKEKKKKAKARKAEQKQAAEEAEKERITRETRAEEQRIAAELAAAGWCSSCRVPLVGARSKAAFHRLEYSYCSVKCVNDHRRVLAAEAAERRLQGGGSGGA